MPITNDPNAKGMNPEESRFLVLGGTGFLGRQVVREFAGRRWPVVAMRRWDTPSAGLDLPGVETIVGEIFEPASLKEAMASVNGVVYCVAPDPGEKPREIMRKSVEGVRRVLEACREYGVERLVLTSSASTVGRSAPGRRATEEQFYLPGSSDDPFAEGKYAVELEAYRYIADGMDVVILNPSLMIGPGVDLSAYARLGAAPDQPINVIDVREAAKMHAEAMIHGRRGERYLLGGKNTTAGQVFDGWSSRGKNVRVPREAYLVEKGQWLDVTKAREELGLAREP